MLKFKTSCAVLAYLLSNLLNEVGLSLFQYLEVGLRVCDIVVKEFTFAISSPDEFLYILWPHILLASRAETGEPIINFFTQIDSQNVNAMQDIALPERQA